MNNGKERIINYVKENKKDLVNKFSNLDKFPSAKKPFAIFMAGSPCSGKTEWSLSFINIFKKK